ncbi:hypothetical protein [Ralstonia pseudosolanacearum]|uniref:hypothetical protein n=1 Tax=Ralstonia pseudosolanacearum TaxID=1310165 RepID=UPI001FF909E4|nr:hypothetical protein [Ralstonia pseudosolanacearum]
MMNWIGGITLIWRRCILIAWVSTHCQATSAIDCRSGAGAHATQRTVWRAFEGLVAKSEIAPTLAALRPAVCWLPDAQELACYRADADAGHRDADFYWVKSPDPREAEYPLYYHAPSARTMEFGQLAPDARLVVRCLAGDQRTGGH